jgi:hypothetical protein
MEGKTKNARATKAMRIKMHSNASDWPCETKCIFPPFENGGLQLFQPRKQSKFIYLPSTLAVDNRDVCCCWIVFREMGTMQSLTDCECLLRRGYLL